MNRLLIAVGLLTLATPIISSSSRAAEQAAQEESSKPLSKAGDQPITNFSYSYKSPILAGVLSIVPGLGQVYNEDYWMGGTCFVVDVGLYLVAASYAGLLDPTRENKLTDASIILLAVAGGIHLFSIFDATLEAVRRNENIEKWGLMITPNENGFRVAYQFRF